MNVARASAPFSKPREARTASIEAVLAQSATPLIIMTISRSKAQDYAELVLSKPQGSMNITLSHGRSGVSLLFKRRVLTRCHASSVGRLQAYYMARILGVDLPQPGASVEASVPGGVLYRAIAVSGLDLRRPWAKMILAQHLDIADMQRGGGSTP